MCRLVALAALLLACDRRSTSAGSPTPASNGSSAAVPTPTAMSCDDPAARPSGSPGPACTQYESPRDAFLQAIAGDPLVLAVGEVHAPRGASVPSAAKRFTDEFLPLLAGRASDLLVELMMPPDGCVDAASEARRKQAPVTSRHAESDQNEYFAMGERARALGIVPDMLRPTCADMDAIVHAGDDMVDVSLTTIARLSREQAIRLVDRDALSDADRGKMVVLYGGALHNDLHPPAGSDGARWSYAPELDAHVHGRLRVLDLIVPEYIGEDETWRSLPWWTAYEARWQARSGAGARVGETRAGESGADTPGVTTLFHTAERTSWLIFPGAIPP
jgi:hypothetical protein